MNMTLTYKQPYDLADALCKELRQRKPLCPPLEQVATIFETLYFASLRTEESQSVFCHIIYLDPANPDPEPPERVVNDRWSFVPFSEPILFSVSDLVKIARASDPRTSSFVVFPNQSGQLHMWGLVDQGNRYHDFLNYDSESGPERPGLFQASILGVGHLVIISKGVLRQSTEPKHSTSELKKSQIIFSLLLVTDQKTSTFG